MESGEKRREQSIGELSEAERERVLSILAKDGVVIVPLDVAYALLTMSERGVERIHAMKGRSLDRPSVVLGTPDVFRALTDSRFADAIDGLRSPVGLVENVNAKSELLHKIPRSIVKSNSIAIFLNTGRLGSDLARHALDRGEVIVGSSGNISGTGNNYRLEDVEPSIRSAVDLAIDRGEVPYQGDDEHGKPLGSTMVDLRTGKIIRHGLVEDRVKEELMELGLEVEN